MDLAGQNPIQFTVRLRSLAGLIWYQLRSPRITAGIIGIWAIIFLLSFVIPQQAAPDSSLAAQTAWIAGLPSVMQLWGEPLFFLGFARILHSFWFWIPLALLLLNSLIALADYSFGTWQRLGRVTPSIQWQHPLADRIEHSERLPEAPDAFLGSLKKILEVQKFFLYEPAESDGRLIGAVRGRWSWLGVTGFYAGLILLIAAFSVSHFFLKTERFTLSPLEPRLSDLFTGEFELTGVDIERGLSQVTFTPRGNEPASQQLIWRLYQPSFLNSILILPAAFDPILTVEARSPTGIPVRLMPAQENLAPAERLNLPLTDIDAPLYFLIPSANLAFQILADPTSAGTVYNIQVRHGAEASPSENIRAQAGEAFQVDNFSVVISLDHEAQLIARYDPAWFLYLLGVMLIVTSGLLLLLRPPLQLWLIPDVKGRGGQLYGVLEKLGPIKNEPQFLEQLLSGALASTDPPE